MKLQSLSKLVLTFGAAGLLVACGNGAKDDKANDSATSNDATSTETGTTKGGAVSGEIIVVSREDGSGTRGAFTELTGVLVEEGDTEADQTTADAIIQNSTDGVMTTVAGEPNAIGYISLGSLNDSVRAIPVDGVEATPENVLDESYPIARPFNIAWKGDLSAASQDFHDFIMSSEGQAVVEGEGYVTINPDAPAYKGDGSTTGEIAISGSTSVTPVMEKLQEAYTKVNPGVTITITSNGSSAGMTAAMEGTSDIGMASRALSEDEKAELNSDAIARDGIAVIVQKDNGIETISLDDLRQVFTGEITAWEDLAK